MKKRAHWKRLLAGALCVCMLLGAVPAASAASTGTIVGEAETIALSSAGALSRETDFNAGWKFYLGNNSSAYGKNFDDSGWKSVDLPHDFSISQSFTTSGEAESGFLPGGTGWYRKTFTLPADCAGKSILLNFDGVYSDAYVYVNGAQVGEHHYGYTPFAFDLSSLLTCDGVTENVIAVKAVNNIPSSRWYSGSGIYRDVTLLIADPIHVDRQGTYVTTPNISSGNGTVKVQVDVVNDSGASAAVTVTNTVLETGDSASTVVTAPAGGTVTATASPVVSNPALWSTDAPNLYTVRTVLSVNGTQVDSYDTTFGFRYFSFDSTGFHLNGKNVKLNGVCMHHDQGALGSAAYYDAMYRQLTILKDMGCNAIRTSHNPADEHFIDICNELGLLVIEEAFDGWVDAKNGNSNDFSRYFRATMGNSGLYGAGSSMTWAEFAMKSIVKRDRNDPAVIAWSLGNEVQEGTSWTNVSSYATIAQNLINWIKEMDTTRPATSGDNNLGGDTRLAAVLNTIRNNGGVVGFNYANSASSLRSLAQSYGGGVAIASETASATNSRGIYSSQSNNSNADGKYHLTSYDTSAVSWGITAHESIYNTYQYDCIAGEFVWTGFDYIGEPTPWNGTGSGSVGSGATPNSSYFGIIETTGFEKDTYYLYRSQWNQAETTLHLVTAWDSGNMMTSGGKTPVWIYSNAPVVKLYRNGTLIGTATRAAHTSSAGHTYYTYSTTSENNGVCTAVSQSGASALYAVFNVTYASGTLSAKAFDAYGNEIALTGNSGRNTVSTPGSVSRLNVSVNRTEMLADGSSLAYIAVDVTDANGNPDTTADNTITFSLTGEGEIFGVDNGNQATTAKYQQSSVLTSTASARIAAYAGKALVIVKSTNQAGSFTVKASASGLTGGNVTVTTNEVDSGETVEGLASYTMVRNYTVKAGTQPALQTTATALSADGTAYTGTILWDSVPASVYETPGDYTVNGVLTFAGFDSLEVSCKLHVIANVIAMRNVSTATTPETVPTLPAVASGILADGTLSGTFTVTWDEMQSSMFASAGDVVTVQGTAVVFGTETLPITASIRVAEAVNTESTNVAPQVSSLTQDIAAGKQSDNLESIINGTTKPGDNTSERWTNWNNRTTSAEATLTFRWATAQLLGSVNLYYYYDNCCAYPEKIVMRYSLNGTDFQEIGFTAALEESYSLGAKYSYTFDKTINPVAVQITFTQKSGTTGNNCVGLTEAEMMTYAGKLAYRSSAALSGISVDGTPLEGFAADTLTYTASGTAVTAVSDDNAAITILPALNGVVRILTVSEDGSAVRTYAVTLSASCLHENRQTRGAKDATCTEQGYTGDVYCLDCGALLESGSTIPAEGHSEAVRGAKDATCTEQGYTGDVYCTVCGETLRTGSVLSAEGHSWTPWSETKGATCTETGRKVRTCTACGIQDTTEIAAKGHKWNAGTITKEPTTTEEGIRTYTCQTCGATRTEPIDKLLGEKKTPVVTVSAARSQSSAGRIALSGKLENYENLDEYYNVVEHGIIYLQSYYLGTKTLTINTAGRTRVRFGGYKADGSYTYNMKPASVYTVYVVRAYAVYENSAGNRVYVYSAPMRVSYNGLAQ